MAPTTSQEPHQPGIELTNREEQAWLHDDHGQLAQALPPADTGRQAWTLLAACFLLECLIWGFPFSFGIFQVYYSTHEPFASQPNNIASIGTTATGLMYFGAPFVAISVQRWPRQRRLLMAIGMLVVVVSMLAASFCNTVAGLIATEGVLYAVGGVFAYFPSVSLVQEWFVRRRGFAYGVVFAGTAISGVVFPFLLRWLLDSYGFRTALRVWALVMAISSVPIISQMKNRLPMPAVAELPPINLKFMGKLPFWIFMLCTAIQGLGFFIPPTWLPSFVESYHMPAFVGPLVLAVYNVGGSVGYIGFGALGDKFHACTAVLISTIGQMIAAFVFWGCTTSQPMLYIFAITWGVSAYGFAGIWSSFIHVMAHWEEQGSQIDSGIAISLLAAAKGVGAVLAGPVSERLLAAGSRWHAGLAYGSDYGILIVFTGVCASLGGSAWIARLVKLV